MHGRKSNCGRRFLNVTVTNEIVIIKKCRDPAGGFSGAPAPISSRSIFLLLSRLAEIPLFLPDVLLLVLLLLLLKQFVELPLGHAGILGDDAVLVQARQQQQQQEAHCSTQEHAEIKKSIESRDT